MRIARSLLVVVVLASIVLGIRASYLNLEGRPQWGTSVALGVTLMLLSLLVLQPALHPPRPPKVTVTAPEADPGEIYGHDSAGFEYTRDAAGNTYRYTDIGPVRMPPQPLPARWWNGPGRLILVVSWLARSVLAGYAAYFVSEQIYRGFNLTLLEFAVVAQVLSLVLRIAQQLSGFRLNWSSYRGWAGVRKLANTVVLVVLAGYAFVVADILGAVVSAIPLFTYRTLDGMWHLPWLNVPIVVVVTIVAIIILAVVVSWVQSLIARALGPDSALGEKLDELRIIKWEGDPRMLWRRDDPW